MVTVTPEPVPSSCADIIESSPLSVSGYYVVRSSSGSLVQVYCNMGVVCGGNRRGWMRLVVSDLVKVNACCFFSCACYFLSVSGTSFFTLVILELF